MKPTEKIAARLNEAIAHHNAGRADRAEAIYRQLAAVAPRNAVVFYLWAQALEEQGKLEDAIRTYARSVALDPKAVTTVTRYAGALIAVGRLADAETVLRRTVALLPADASAWNALGFVLKVRGKAADAVGCHERAVKLDPSFAAGWCHFGLTLGVIGRNFQALKCFEHALKLSPGDIVSRFGRAQSLHKVYRLEEAIAGYDAVLQADPRHAEARSYRLFALQNLDSLSREQLFAEHVAYGASLGCGPVSLPPVDASPERRLRLAILSPDMRTHSCAYFLEPLLEHLDPAQFELFLYHDHFIEDAVSARFRQKAKVWRNFVGQPLATVKRVIRADQPDILIDLSGHVTGTVRLPLFAQRMAPVQITYLGYPDTSGVPNMDYRFTDGIADPVGDADRFATEQLVRFAPTAWAFRPPSDAPAVVPPPCAGSGAVTFGCFNSPSKFTPAVFAAWARLLECVPGSRLLLKGRDLDEPEVRADMLERLRASGLPLERIELLPRTPDTASHLAQYAQVDVALDTFPYNGTTTTCEALWMGRPVVTIGGDRHASRVGVSLLTAVGHREWIASDSAEYVRIAAELARDPVRLPTLSARLRDELRASPLLDHRAQSGRFTAALRQCWRERCAGRAVDGAAA